MCCADWKFVREFLVVYRYFLPPDDLLNRLINRCELNCIRAHTARIFSEK